MAKLVRKTSRALLWIGLLLISIRYIFQPLSSGLSWNRHYLPVMAEWLDIHGGDNIDFLDSAVALSLSAVLASVSYLSALRLYRRLRRESSA